VVAISTRAGRRTALQSHGLTAVRESQAALLVARLLRR
jgi:hypothetical protein